MPYNSRSQWEADEARADNLTRLMNALSKGLHGLVRLAEGKEVFGFVVRIDDAPYGPLAVVHIPDGQGMQVCYRDPEEMQILLLD